MRPFRIAPLVLALGAAVLVAGCAEDVGLPPRPAAAFTLWGAFDPTAPRQMVRVVPLDPDIEPDPPGPIDATVTSHDFATGVTTTWRDSLVQYADGTTGHLFIGAVPVTYGGRYRLEARRSDGVTARATLLVPPLVQPVLEADPAHTPIERVAWPGAPQVNAVEVVYLVENANCQRREVAIPFEGVTEPTEFGWRVVLDLEDEYVRLRRDALDGLPHALASVTVRGEVAGADWRFPSSAFDPVLLQEPGAFSNVEGGFGFVGAAYPVAFSWQPDNRAVAAAGIPRVGFGC